MSDDIIAERNEGDTLLGFPIEYKDLPEMDFNKIVFGPPIISSVKPRRQRINRVLRFLRAWPRYYRIYHYTYSRLDSMKMATVLARFDSLVPYYWLSVY